MLDTQNIFEKEDADAFVRRALGRHALHLHGDRNRFRDVVSWKTVSHLVAFGGLAFPRLRLIKGEQFLDEGLYLRRDRRGYSKAAVAEMNALLREGALLAIDGLELLHPPVGDLCASIETIVRTPVAAELYACCNEGAPRVPQWDDHETLLVQVEGHRRWQLFEPTASYPVEGSPAPRPSAGPNWSGALAAGDLLYIPRGWWYQEEGFDGPALYLALTFRNLNAIDVIARLLLKALEQPYLRADVPRFQGPEARSAFLTTVQREVMSLANAPGLFTEFLREMQESSDLRCEFNFPWSATGHPLPMGGECRLVPLLRFPSAFSLASRAACDRLLLPYNGVPVELDWEAGEILEMICACRGPMVAGVIEKYRATISPDRIVAHVEQLIRLGLVAARPCQED
jgi:hypothetical protein